MGQHRVPAASRRHEGSRRAARVEALVKLFEIRFDLARYPYELSGGQMQTVCIMRSLATEPEVLFLDEPFSALDFEMTLFIRAKLQEAHMATGTTMVIVSHDLEDAVFLADRILLLTRRPTRIAELVSFEMPRPRPPEAVADADSCVSRLTRSKCSGARWQHEMTALTLDTYNLTKRFGAFTALDGVSLAVRPGSVHALLGENGAGKSTLVKCVVGYHRPDDGGVLLDGREHDIASPTVARELGIGMVYQHFTVVPGMTVAENLLLARGKLPAGDRLEGGARRARRIPATTPFRLDLDATPLDLSAGEKQKLEILKQLFLKPRLLILDEPTSVLTPQEADEVLGLLRERAHAGDCSIVMITHKFREVNAYADDVSVLRRGGWCRARAWRRPTPTQLAAAMVGEA